MKVVIGNIPKEPTLSLDLKAYDQKQVTLVGHLNTAEGGNHIAWVTANGEFVVHDAALSRLGLKLKHYC